MKSIETLLHTDALTVSGKTVVLHFKQNGRVDYGSVNDLNTFHENDRVSKDDTTVPITKVWMQSKFRRTYPEGIIYRSP